MIKLYINFKNCLLRSNGPDTSHLHRHTSLTAGVVGVRNVRADRALTQTHKYRMNARARECVCLSLTCTITEVFISNCTMWMLRIFMLKIKTRLFLACKHSSWLVAFQFSSRLTDVKRIRMFAQIRQQSLFSFWINSWNAFSCFHWFFSVDIIFAILMQHPQSLSVSAL